MRASCVVSLCIAIFSGGTAIAQPYPTHPITIVVPFAAGGPIDTTTRVVTQKMAGILGQAFIVENVTGAAGSIAAARVAKSAPDGYTLMTGIWGTHVANGAIYRLTYNVQSDFAPIALVSSNPLLIVSSNNVPANNLADLVSWLKANPDKATQGTSGIGSVGHIGGIFFQKQTGTKFSFVPYRGLAPAMQDLTAGRIDLMFDTPATSLPQIHAGNIRAYAVTSPRRIASAPDIPTVDEAGLKNLYVTTWTGLFAPKGTSDDIIDKLGAAVRQALADPELQERLAAVGQLVYPPDQQFAQSLAKLQDDDIKKWWPIIKEANVKAD
jgi:tripartite-type tricarboxylate transporter receptor subunit TctC